MSKREPRQRSRRKQRADTESSENAAASAPAVDPKATDDPHAQREADKYSEPVASREWLLQLLNKHGAPLSIEALAAHLGYHDNEDPRREGLRRRLRAMCRDAELIRNRNGGYVPVSTTDLVTGRISAHPDGYGFLIPDAGGEDMFLSAREMRQALHGDRIIGCITGEDRRGRLEGRIVEVVERANLRIVGRLAVEQGVNFVVPDNKRIHQDVVVADTGLAGAAPGDMVVVEIIEHPSRRHPPVGKIAEVLGQHLRPGMEIDVALHSSDIPFEWPDAVLAEADAFGDAVVIDKTEKRRDVRKLPLLTIDGEDARDFDDAVYCEKTESGWRLLVAIADVSHYVAQGSALDQEALDRGTSVYFPGQVVPMLPEALSNGLCSLNPDVDRLCMLCVMTLDADGHLKQTRLQRALMRSHARLTYTQVNAMLVEKDRALQKQHADVYPHLKTLYQLYRKLARLRRKRGSIEFESNETRIDFDEQRKIKAIVPVVRNDAHKLIEECMILANVATAGYLMRRRIPALYRVHVGLKTDRLEELQEFLRLRGLRLTGGDQPSAQDFARLAERTADRPDAAIIHSVMLRSMQQAVYQPVCEGHFGLALEHYAHFTSPIRRYPDLLVHRAIGHIIDGGKADNYGYDHPAMEQLGQHCSMTERRADEATRDVVAWLKCEYMMQHVGEEFDGVVSTVTSFGLFVQLNDIYIEGLAHIAGLGDDYFHFDRAAHTLVGERSGRIYTMGDPVRVQVVAVNLDERKIDLKLIDTGSSQRGGKQKSHPRDAATGDGKNRKKSRKPKSKSKGKGKEKSADKARTKSQTKAQTKKKSQGKAKSPPKTKSKNRKRS